MGGLRGRLYALGRLSAADQKQQQGNNRTGPNQTKTEQRRAAGAKSLARPGVD